MGYDSVVKIVEIRAGLEEWCDLCNNDFPEGSSGAEFHDVFICRDCADRICKDLDLARRECEVK